MKNYDESMLPWPLKPLIKLDYCWRVNYAMFKHSWVVGLPVTSLYFIYTEMPGVWKLTRKTFPKLKFVCDYLLCVALLNSINISFSLVFDDFKIKN